MASSADFAFENLHKTRLSFGKDRAVQGWQSHKLSDDLHSRPEQNVGQSAPATANAYTNPTVDFGKMQVYNQEKNRAVSADKDYKFCCF